MCWYSLKNIIVLLYLLLGACKALQDGSCDYIGLSYEMCTSDSECISRFYLETTESDYRRQLFTYMCDMHIDAMKMRDILSSKLCTSPEIKNIWMNLLLTFSFCKENHSYEIGNGCVCNSGKSCNELSGFDNVHQSHFVRVSLIVVVLITIYAYCHTLSKLKHTLQRVG